MNKLDPDTVETGATPAGAQTATRQLTAADLVALRFPRNSRPAPLTNHAIDWILYLPDEVRPLLLGKGYPRVTNILADAWLRPPQFKACLAEFLYDKRPNRLGFPAEVAAELKNLENYFDGLQYSAWDSKHN